jgi:hypothetical protein
MWPEINHHHLSIEAPERLRPTQMSVGLAEVATKRREWAALGKKARQEVLERQVFPAVRGPKGRYYIIDHHHLGLALIEEKVQQVLIHEFDDLSWLAPQVFWRTMEFRSWAHPFDARGQRRDYADIPRRLTELQDDPYRSLAGRVRRAGGCAKSVVPFAEFLWADFFRDHIGAGLLRRAPAGALREAVRLARSTQARYLPGWSGRSA